MHRNTVDQFLVTHVRDAAGKVIKFYWIEFVEPNIEIAEKMATLSGKSVDLISTSNEFFDTKVKEYRKFSVITKINVK